MALEISHPKAGFQHNKVLDTDMRDALAGRLREKYPTAKHLARALDLSLDEARGVFARRASLRVLEHILKHPNGGWAVVLPVLGDVIGQSLDDWHDHERQHHEKLARRHRMLVQGRVSDHDESDGARAELDRTRDFVGRPGDGVVG
jgi:hypothetical protein